MIVRELEKHERVGGDFCKGLRQYLCRFESFGDACAARESAEVDIYGFIKD